MTYLILDNQWPYQLDWYESTLRDVVIRLLSFHAADNDMEFWTIWTLLDMEWMLSSPEWSRDLTYKLIKKYKQWKWARQFKKLAKKYTKLYY